MLMYRGCWGRLGRPEGSQFLPESLGVPVWCCEMCEDSEELLNFGQGKTLSGMLHWRLEPYLPAGQYSSFLGSRAGRVVLGFSPIFSFLVPSPHPPFPRSVFRLPESVPGNLYFATRCVRRSPPVLLDTPMRDIEAAVGKIGGRGVLWVKLSDLRLQFPTDEPSSPDPIFMACLNNCTAPSQQTDINTAEVRASQPDVTGRLQCGSRFARIPQRGMHEY
jgi:hypothetical protein